MNNPWIEFANHINEKNLILKEEISAVDKFNESTKNDLFKIHKEIMPAPFMGNVHTAPIVLLLLNPGYDREEEKNDFYNKYSNWWKQQIQNKKPQTDLALFCLDDEYVLSSPYWANKLKPLINIVGKEQVSKNVCMIQFFPYHTGKHKNISSKILKTEGFDEYLLSQKYNFHLVKEAMKRDAIIIIMRSEKLWYSAVPELKDYQNKHKTKSYLNTILSENNLGEAYSHIIQKLNPDKLDL